MTFPPDFLLQQTPRLLPAAGVTSLSGSLRSSAFAPVDH
jgi:hypothetical protein